jgi:predicted amidohydrolase
VIRTSPARILAFLNVSFAGIYGFSKRAMVGEGGDLRLMAPIDAVETIRANRDTIAGIKGPLTTMSKFLCLGMPLGDVVRAATEAPANALRRSDLGSFRQGGAGDASILALENGDFDYVNVTGEQLSGRMRLFARGVVLNGNWWNG